MWHNIYDNLQIHQIGLIALFGFSNFGKYIYKLKSYQIKVSNGLCLYLVREKEDGNSYGCYGWRRYIAVNN